MQSYSYVNYGMLINLAGIHYTQIMTIAIFLDCINFTEEKKHDRLLLLAAAASI